MLEALPDARFALVGDGPHRQQLEKHFEGTATTFVGYLAGEELAGAYASGDAFLIPLKHRDPRAWCFWKPWRPAVPVVGANRGGIPDIITDGENGCLYEPGGEDGGAASLIEATKSTARKRSWNDRPCAKLRVNEAERWGWAGATEQLRGLLPPVFWISLSSVRPDSPAIGASALTRFLPLRKNHLGHRQRVDRPPSRGVLREGHHNDLALRIRGVSSRTRHGQNHRCCLPRFPFCPRPEESPAR